MSDIGILNDPVSIAVIYLSFGAPGLLSGAILGALLWRKHRIYGALIGAAFGFPLSIGTVWIWLLNQ